jgi:hypothetical protein
MGLTFTKLFAKLFSKKEMRILMARAAACCAAREARNGRAGNTAARRRERRRAARRRRRAGRAQLARHGEAGAPAGVGAAPARRTPGRTPRSPSA